jgi:hypothetical protein
MIDSVENMKVEPSSPIDRDHYSFSRSSSTGSLHTLSTSTHNTSEGQGGMATGNMSSSSGHGNSSVIKLVAWCMITIGLFGAGILNLLGPGTTIALYYQLEGHRIINVSNLLNFMTLTIANQFTYYSIIFFNRLVCL